MFLIAFEVLFYCHSTPVQYQAKPRFHESQFHAEYLVSVTNPEGVRILWAIRFYTKLCRNSCKQLRPEFVWLLQIKLLTMGNI